MDTYLHFSMRKFVSVTQEVVHICSSHTFGVNIGSEVYNNMPNAVNAFKLVLDLPNSLRKVPFNLIPFHLRNHWHLIIVSGLDGQNGSMPQILHLNSLDFIRIDQPLQTALQEVIKERTGKVATWTQLQVPQKKNSDDCGFFVMKFIVDLINNLSISEQIGSSRNLMATKVYEGDYECFNLRNHFQKQMKTFLFGDASQPVQISQVVFEEYQQQMQDNYALPPP